MLAARLELPVDKNPHAYALLVHCFTCGKNLKALYNISRLLSVEGIAVMRLDFTGIGEKKLDSIADENFAACIDDIVDAAYFLKENYDAPDLLIGHSLGGTAMLLAASRIPTARAVVTIGAFMLPQDIRKLIVNDKVEIDKSGLANIRLAGCGFNIKKQFLNELEKDKTKEALQQLGTPLLIMHSVSDHIAAFENAAAIFEAACHPKSIISLDAADHLISKDVDSYYVGKSIVCWVSRYLPVPAPEPLESEQRVVTRTRLSAFTTEIRAGNHGLIADEPVKVGGSDLGPTPYDLVVAGLGACTGMTIRLVAKAEKIPLKNVIIHLQHGKVHEQDCEHCEDEKSKIDSVHRTIELDGPLSPEQKQRLLEVADKCPVHRTLQPSLKIFTELVEKKP